MISLPESLRVRAAEIRALALDVDGVLTDGSLAYGPDGEMLKTFSVRDGLGIRLLREAGIAVAVISAKRSSPLVARIRDLRIEHALLARDDKASAIGELAAALGVATDAIAYAGDDLLDLPALERVGISIAPADAHPRVLANVSWITKAAGGRGAVREIADDLLEARGELDATIARLLGSVA